jgi:4-hydroxy-tetrahydrodipicolinate synthase
LSFDLRVEMIKESSRILKERIPLLVGISDTSATDSVRLAKVAAEHGADAVVSAPPYYYSTSQSELAEFYENLIPRLPLPIFLYNMPSHTKVSFAPSTVLRLAENEKVIGFKDSSANGTYFQVLTDMFGKRKDFSLFVGPEEMMAQAVLLGASGGVNGGANMFPELYVDLFNAAVEADMDKIKELQAQVMKISNSIYNVVSCGSSYLRGLKCALSVLGICDDFLATPYKKFDEKEREKIKIALDSLQFSYFAHEQMVLGANQKK